MQTMALPNVSTAEGLLALPEDDDRYELIHGELIAMSPVNYDHGTTVCRFAHLLLSHLDTDPSGDVVTETGFILNRSPDHVVGPDIAYVRKEKAPAPGTRGFLELVPDLVAEVLSPDDRCIVVTSKVTAYLEAGVAMVLIIDPVARAVTVHRSADDAVILHEQDTLDASGVVPGWQLPLVKLFAR